MSSAIFLFTLAGLLGLHQNASLAAPISGAPTLQSSGAPEAALPARIRAEIAEVSRMAADPSRDVHLARLHYLLGENLSSETEKLASYRVGLDYAAQARKAAPGLASARLWQVANRAALAQRGSIIESLDVLSELERELLEARRLDPSLDHSAADRALGVLYASGPAIISVGSPRKAEEAFRAALKRDPDYPGNQAYYSRFLLEVRADCASARKLASQVVAQQSEISEKYPFEAPHWLDVARVVLRKSEGRCSP